MLLKVAKTNKKLLTIRKGYHFREKNFQTTKFYECAHNMFESKFEKKS